MIVWFVGVKSPSGQYAMIAGSDWEQNLELGLDQSATAEGLEAMDRALPSVSPQEQGYQAHLVGGQ